MTNRPLAALAGRHANKSLGDVKVTKNGKAATFDGFEFVVADKDAKPVAKN